MSETVKAPETTDQSADSAVAAAKPVARKDPHAEAKRQRVVTPEYLFLEAPRTKEFITGSEAAKEAIRRGNVDLAIAYPITPQSETMQLVGVLYGEGYVKEYYRGEEEVGVMAAIAADHAPASVATRQRPVPVRCAAWKASPPGLATGCRWSRCSPAASSTPRWLFSLTISKWPIC